MRVRRAVPFAAATVLLLLFSYVPYLAPRRAIDLPFLMVFWTWWCTTVMILCDEARRRLEGMSLLDAIVASPAAFLRFLATGAACGLLLDGSAQWIGKLWIYPYWNPAVYGGTFVIGFCAYWLLLAETYFLAKALLRRLRPVSSAFSPKHHRATAPMISGSMLAGTGLLLAAADYRAAGGYRFAITRPTPVHVHFACFLLLFTGAWLLLEALQRRQGKPSLLDAMGRRDWVPPAALLSAGWIFGFLMETTNAGQHFWIYTNWPLPKASLCGVPAVVLLAWPLQYVVFLSTFNVFAGPLAGPLVSEVWR